MDGPRRRRQLDRLTDAFVYKAQKMDSWPSTAEGEWIVVPLGADFAICQWECLNCQFLWMQGIRSGLLKVVRIVPPEKVARLLARPVGPKR